MLAIPPLDQLVASRFDTPAILKRLASASRKLAELKGIAASIPNQGILINALGLQEAKDSSEIENIVTTHDELFKDEVLPDAFANPAAKEVLRYRQALHLGYRLVRDTGLITTNHLIQIQGELERNNAGFRRLLDVPVLYLSRYIVSTKADYYRLLQAVRDEDVWEQWVLYMLEAVEQTAGQTITTIHAIKEALFDYKHRIRDQYKFYSQDLINNLFMHPYTKIEFVENDLGVSRLTATKYLDALNAGGFVQKQKVGRSNYYVNLALNRILLGNP